MKILSAAQIREADANTILHEPIASIDLMERAANAFVDWFSEKFSTEKQIIIFCGPGNNGGDGLAIARLLLERKYSVQTFIIESEKYSQDFQVNQKRLSDISTLFYIKSKKDIPGLNSDTVIIDAIFGSGLTRPATGLYGEVINEINQSKAIITSVDIASGLFTDISNNDNDVVVNPTYTVSFQIPKLSFLLPQNEKRVGTWTLVDIGLNQTYFEKAETSFHYNTDSDIKALIKSRGKFSHKGNFGKSLIIGGSYGMMGAMVLAAKACLRTGVGLSVTCIPKCGYDILQTAVPENMVISDQEFDYITDVPDLTSFDSIGIGPGLGKNPSTVNAFEKLLNSYQKPIVIDADALNILSENSHLVKSIPSQSILTPHPKEFERLVGKSFNDFHRLDLIKDFSKKTNSIIVLKGAHTAIASPEGKIHFNSTGNPGMATGGSGDVLTGIITSLLAQGYQPLQAALLGVYLHGYAGDLAAKEKTIYSLLPSDIIEAIPEFYKSF